MHVRKPGHASDYTSPLWAAFRELEENHGRETAVNEANLILSSLISRFNLGSDDLSIQQRASNPHSLGLHMPTIGPAEGNPIQIPPRHLLPKSLCIYYGSYTKTCENLANNLKREAESQGLNVVECETLDTLTGRILPFFEMPVFIITSTIHGGPPPNARHFVNWLKTLAGDALKGVQFAVFGSGAGKRDTYQANPKLIQELMKRLGGVPIMARGEGNADGSTRRDFVRWKKNSFWPYWGIDAPPLITAVKVTTSQPVDNPDFTYKLGAAVVLKNELLVRPAGRDKEARHITLKLPRGLVYETGDYLSVLPRNPRENVQRAMKKFGLKWDTILNITEGGLVLPEGPNISPWRVFSEYVELGRLALEGDIRTIARFAQGRAKEELVGMLDASKYAEDVLKKRVSPLDLIEKYKISMDLGSFLSMLPPMEYRRYSISSSPLADPDICTLTYSVLDDRAFSGQGQFHGVASTYLSRLQQDFLIEVGHASSDEFRLPTEPEKTPIIMLCTGTGLSPFRAFVQERAAIKAKKPTIKLAPALLFFGCRSATRDRIHGDELDKWEEAEIVKVRYAFSEDKRQYVQEVMRENKGEIQELTSQGAVIYICGSTFFLNGDHKSLGVRQVLIEIFKDMKMSDSQITELFDERFHADVFG